MSSHEFDSFIAIIGAVLLVLGVSSGLIRNRWHVSEPVVALVVGVLIGPVSGWLSLESLGGNAQVVEQAARLTLGIALMDVALTLPSDYVRRHWRTLAFFLGLILPLMWMTGSGIAAVCLGIGFVPALLIGGVLAPTDPVIAGTIATGRLAERWVPERLRRALLVESGANDALALPFVMLPLLLMSQQHPAPLEYWVVHVVLWEILGAVALGLLSGYAAGRVTAWVAASRYAERSSLLSVSLAVVLLLLGVTRLAHLDGLLAAFVAGLVLNRYITGELEGQKNLAHETLLRFFELPIFLVLGTSLPWTGWLDLGWQAALFVAGVLLLRRLPAILVLWRLSPPLVRWRDALFMGWFGPMGVATLYYAAFAAARYDQSLPWTVATLVVTASVVIHGVGATGLTKLYGRINGSPASAGDAADSVRASPAMRE